ncbi:MAG TPA: DUF2818 family protein [Halothiobacillaceae bacterium]|nr:DUF2818 family protein [Halothiobacillaceae bacterium]
MIPDSYVYGYLLLMLLLANLPFVNQRLFLVIAVSNVDKQGNKAFWIRLIEFGVYYALAIAAGLGIEYYLTGITPKDWVFWATTLAMFAVFASIGFLWQYQLRKQLGI